MTKTTRHRLLFVSTVLMMALAEAWIHIGWKWFVVMAVLGADLAASAVLGLAPFDLDDRRTR